LGKAYTYLRPMASSETVQKNGHTVLSVEENRALTMSFNRLIDSFKKLTTAELSSQVKGSLSSRSWSALVNLGRLSDSFPTSKQLATLLAYQQMIGEPLQLEFRHEGWKAYLLCPLSQSLTLTGKEAMSLLWVHSKEWASERFLDPKLKPGDYGLCGQSLGTSKFATAGTMPSTKDGCLDALGLRGYEAFDQQEQPLFVVECKMNTTIGNLAQPMIPLLYLLGTATESKATPMVWDPAPHFQEGTVPGFTSGLRAEVVIKTFQLQEEEMVTHGVTCHLLK